MLAPGLAGVGVGKADHPGGLFSSAAGLDSGTNGLVISLETCMDTGAGGGEENGAGAWGTGGAVAGSCLDSSFGSGFSSTLGSGLSSLTGSGAGSGFVSFVASGSLDSFETMGSGAFSSATGCCGAVQDSFFGEGRSAAASPSLPLGAAQPSREAS